VVPVSVAENVGTIPSTGLFPLSLRVIVIVDVAEPLAMTGPVPEISELTATGNPALNKTDPPDLETGVRIERVFVSAVKDFNEQVERPVLSEELHTP
jgi:hypothetical protein